jgi:type II secretory pathway component PulM
MSLAQAWRQRSAAQRQRIVVLTGFVAIVLFITFAWLPLERARARLEAELPRLRASVSELEREAQEVQRLRGAPVAASSTPALPGALPALGGAQVATSAPGRYRVTANDVEAGALLEWLGVAASQQGLAVQAAHLERSPAPGHWRGEITLARP